MSRKVWRAASAAVMFGFLFVLAASPAMAHEDRTVGGFEFKVGWGEEPAYAGLKNSVQLILADKTHKPVPDIGDTLKVDVAFGKETKSLPLEPNFEVGEFGDPGDYRAWFIPTRAGRYTFHFTGNVKGQNVDETFTSSDKTFDDLKDPSEVQFPAKDPGNAQLSERIEREIPRLKKENIERASSLKSDLDKTSKTATYEVLGVGVLALIALILGLLGLRRRP
jgi:hypothetical protein